MTLGPRDDDVFLAGLAAQIDLERSEGPRRRPRNYLARKIVEAVMARAPDLRRLRLELHRALEMRAHCGEGAEVAIARADQNRRLGAELDDSTRVRPELGELARDD